MISIISCISKNYAIGKGNDLVFKIPEDLGHFKRVTTLKPLVMGKNTALSLPLGKPLPNRVNYVLCDIESKMELESKGFIAICGKNIEEALIFIQKQHYKSEILVIGGGMVYKHALKFASKLYLTIVDEHIDNADVFFPDIDWDEWVIASKRAGIDKRLTFYEMLVK
ncbi:dihydrofolate reductase [Vibrio splendidus]|nr:dihydrofolate reductase [Vibrio splendidus]MCC4882872.1 dihydrofolate reductase [Vibrio splendidus]